MKIIVKNKEVLIDDADFINIKDRPIGLYQRKSNPNIYVLIHKARLHRHLLGITDPKIIVDHINGNGLDNRRINLRICSQRDNSKNRCKSEKINATSKYKGVSKHRNSWISQIRVNYKKLHLGSFTSEEFAAKAYNEAALKHFGVFAKINNI